MLDTITSLVEIKYGKCYYKGEILHELTKEMSSKHYNRRVYTDFNIVIKTDFEDNFKQNTNEVNFWKNLKEDFDNFAPVLSYHPNYHWVMMPYYKLVKLDQVSYRKFCLDMTEKHGVYDIYDLDKPSVTMYNGNFLIFDYGMIR